MYKVLIVDDDRIIRKGLMKTIPWTDNGFKLVGEAGDGEQAFDLIKQEHPQIVVSDIRMPFMDGLELARCTREYDPTIKFIFLTGYEDFSYAKEAISLKAIDYLLKPIDIEELVDKVKQAAAAWDKEHNQEKKLQEAKPYFKSDLFQRILLGSDEIEELLTEADSLGLSLRHKYYDTLFLHVDDYENENIHPYETHRGIKQALRSEIEKLLHVRGTCGGLFAMEHDAHAILLSGDDADALEREAHEFAAAVLHIKDSIKATLTIAIGTVQEGLELVKVSFADAQSAMNFRHVMGKNTVITLDDIDHLTQEVQPDTDKKDLVEKVRLGLVDDAQQLLTNLEDQLCNTRLELGEVRLLAVDMLLALFKGAESWASGWSREHQDKKAEYYSRINKMQTVAEIVELLRSLVDSLAQYMSASDSQRASVDIVDEITNYIETHYAEHGLSLQEVGQHVHLNPVYLSVLFKKKKKITFTGFLLQIRMTKAMEMLRTTDLKTYEVAEKTGYSSPEYFGACFKKYTGCSPLEFRNRS